MYRNSFCDWARIVYNVPTIPANPDVTWRPQEGWIVDGIPEPGTSRDIVERYQARMNRCYDAIKTFYATNQKTPLTGGASEESMADQRSAPTM
jgi:hypothetical protein